MNALDRLLAAVPTLSASECWEWPGAVSPTGYGVFATRRRSTTAHRAVYERLVGPIPDGLQLDHLCRRPTCVNPSHMEPVTMLVNIHRGDGEGARNARKTHCPQGHPYDGDNLTLSGGRRHCRACKRESTRRYRANRAMA